MSAASVQDVLAVRPLGGLRLWIRFDDGVEGEVDLRRVLKFRGMNAPLRDPIYCARVFIHPEAKVLTWPNGVDIDTLVLYSKVTRRSIRSILVDRGWFPDAPKRKPRRRAASAR